MDAAIRSALLSVCIRPSLLGLDLNLSSTALHNEPWTSPPARIAVSVEEGCLSHNQSVDVMMLKIHSFKFTHSFTQLIRDVTITLSSLFAAYLVNFCQQLAQHQDEAKQGHP